MVGVRKPKTNCGQCGVKLTSENFSHSQIKPEKTWWVCNLCYRKAMRKYIRKYNKKNNLSTKVHAYTRLYAYRSFALKIVNYKCQHCGIKAEKLQLHHIDGNFKNNEPNNLIMLCLKCHRSKKVLKVLSGIR
jgi:hypothetical protein